MLYMSLIVSWQFYDASCFGGTPVGSFMTFYTSVIRSYVPCPFPDALCVEGTSLGSFYTMHITSGSRKNHERRNLKF
jgi:hypothetical protein